MILLNSVAKALEVDELAWNRLLDAGRESGWTARGARAALALPGASFGEALGQQVNSEDARNLARALRRDREGLARRLEVGEERLEQVLSFLEGGGFVLTSDLFALGRSMGR